MKNIHKSINILSQEMQLQQFEEEHVAGGTKLQF